MKKFSVRLAAALITFSFGLFLTNLLFHEHKCSVNALRRPGIVTTRAVPMSNTFGADEAQIRSLYLAYGPAQTRHDRAFFEKYETEDFILFTDDSTIKRAANINWMTAEPFGDVYERKLTFLQVFGGSAVAHGVMSVREGDGAVYDWAFTDVLVKSNGLWRIRSTTQGD